MGGKSSQSSSSTTEQYDNRLVVGDGTLGTVIGPSAKLTDVTLTDYGAIQAAGEVLQQGSAEVFDFARSLSENILSKVTDVVAEERADDVKEITTGLLKLGALGAVALTLVAFFFSRRR